MEKFKHVQPTKEWENKAKEFINEFCEYNSSMNGFAGLDRYKDDYDGWLQKLEKDRNYVLDEERVPAETYFFVRENDNKIVGIVNIRLALNENLRNGPGHIGYSIRPTERRKGYNKINLYLALVCCQKHGIKEALLSCSKDNLGSSGTMKALGGKLIREWTEKEFAEQQYTINVDLAVEKYKEKYEKNISNK